MSSGSAAQAAQGGVMKRQTSPTPWRIRHDGNALLIETRDRIIVAEVPFPDDDNPSMDAATRADAKLIRAAPELADVLAQIVRSLRKVKVRVPPRATTALK